ncbi:hypothetical protein D9619_012948 [Psilocybe cf. subviscida]|uniref:TPR-like protein n=1 Tax=Psilocybe cf. subviscida TaxID=2480587 RepID=A0A8H5BJT9_9AGAR|nr:hypothetical protein D9619_012948 [Psilocybe cf. subviscida]
MPIEDKSRADSVRSTLAPMPVVHDDIPAVKSVETSIKLLAQIVEEIHTSFVEVSEGLKTAQGQVGELKETTSQLRVYCERNLDVLERAPKLGDSINDLTTLLKSFLDDAVPLIPLSSPDRTKGWKAWKNHTKIEKGAQELNLAARQCYAAILMMVFDANEQAAMQQIADIKRKVSHLMTGKGPLALTSSSSMKAIELPSDSSSNGSDVAELVLTRTSAGTMIWKSPTPVQQQVISEIYLKYQIDSIADSLSGLSTLDLTYMVEPVESYVQPYAPVLTSMYSGSDIPTLQKDLMARALEIRNTLENEPSDVSIQEGAWDLVNLAIGLHYAGMSEEAAKMGKWTVSLFRTLVGADEAIYSPYLIHSLKHLSRYNEDIGNNDGALEAIEEAAEISKGLQTPTAPVEIRVQYGGVLSTYAHKMSSIRKDQKRAIELAEQSVKLMEDINGIDFLPPSYERVDGVVQVSRTFLTRLYQTSPSDQAIADYARALRELSNCLIADDQQQESLDAKLRALPILQDMPSLLADDMDTELAGILYELISQKCKSLLLPEKLLEYAEECVRIYRRHTDLNASMYGRCLCDALWEKANALNTLCRDSDALEVWKEIAEIAQQMMQDQAYYADALYQVSWSFRRLKRHEEAASVRTQSVLTYEAINNTTTGSQANGHYDLCIDYQLARRFPEAVEAAKKAVDQYRVLAFTEADKWTRQIGQALSALANSLFSAGEHEAALNEGHESIQIFESLIKTDPECVKSYVYSLRVNIGLAITVNNESKAIERMDDVLRHMRQLATDFPEEASLALLEAELDYGHNLDRLDRIQEARKYLEDLIAKWEVEEHPHVEKEAFANLHISALISYASILDNQGHTDLALVPIQKGTDIGKPFSETSPVLAGQTVGAMYRHAHLLVELGRYDEALVVAEETLKFNRETKMDNASHLVGTLHVVALAADHTHAYDRVVEVSQEAVDICKSADFVEYCQTNPRSFCLLSRSLQLLSSGQADSGNLELGFKYGQEAVHDAKALRANSRVASADVEQYYMEANGHLGAMYLANDKFAEARGTFEETRAYFTEKVKERNGQFGSLISILRRLGIIYCSEGKHEEGHAAAQEAKKYLDHLAEVFPGLHKLVHIDMRHELSTPSLQVLNRLKEKLSCEHQAELTF